MQQAQTRETTPIHFESQASRVLPRHGAGALEQAVNDDDYRAEGESQLRLALEVAANVLGGTALLASMYYLPHLVAAILR